MIDRTERPSFVKKLQAHGIASTRAEKLRYGVESIHAAMCNMDSHNRKMFDKAYGGDQGIYKLLWDFSEHQIGLRDIFPLDEDGEVQD